jgi:hypothetical protein
MIIPVDKIYEQDGIFHAASVFDSTVNEDLNIILNVFQVIEVVNRMKLQPKTDFYFLTRASQFVVFFQYQNGLGMSMKFTDYKNNLDTALDEYNILGLTDWETKDKVRIMQIFQDIKDNPMPEAELITTNLFS